MLGQFDAVVNTGYIPRDEGESEVLPFVEQPGYGDRTMHILSTILDRPPPLYNY